MFLRVVTGLAVALAGFVGLQEDQELNGAKCIVMGKRAANTEYAVEYMEGNVYLCCRRCVAKFVADQELEAPTFTVKANHQLVVTGQYVQKGCPMSGKPLKEGAVAQVGGVEVGFCCMDCSDKVDAIEDLEAKAEIVFAKVAFERAFAKKADLSNATCPISGGEINVEQFSLHNGGKVYFCCPKCKAKFDEDAEPFVTKSNLQLFVTGQVAQTACPFSGGDMNEEKVVEVSGVNIKLCCGNCVKKVNAADSDDEKAELLFSAKAFKRGFGEE